MTTPTGLLKKPPLTRIQEWRYAVSLEKVLEIKKQEVKALEASTEELRAIRDTNSDQWCVLESNGSFLQQGFFKGFDLGGRAMFSGSLKEAKIFDTMKEAREVAAKVKGGRLVGHLLKDLLKFKDPQRTEVELGNLQVEDVEAVR